MKRFLILITALVLVLSACSGGGKKKEEVKEINTDNLTESGLPVVKEKISLNIFAGQAPATAEDWNDVMLWNEYEKMSNIDVNWEMVPHTGLEEKRNLALVGGKIPDAFHSAVVPVPEILKYGEQGTFIALNDLIEEHAPNFNKLLDENPDVRKAITFPDGNIYSFPLVYDPSFTALRVAEGPWIRQDWLEELNMDIPETTDEFYDYLTAVKNENPGGEKAIPFGAQSLNGLLTYLKGSFGVGNRGKGHRYIDLDPETEKVRFYPTSDGYKEMLTYANKLYKEELIDQNIFTIEHGDFYSNAAKGTYGSTYNHSPTELFGEVGTNYVGGTALEGPNGHRDFAGIGFPSGVTGFLITNANEYPAETVRWMDYFYSDEGIQLFFMGLEGETFEVTEDGEYEYVEDIKNNPDGLTLDQAVAQYLTWPGGQYPGVLKEEFFKGTEGTPSSKEAAKVLEPYFLEDVWPGFTYTPEENKVITSTGGDVEKYVTEMTEKFVAGHESLDKWDDYVKELDKMGVDKYLEIQQQAYERFMSH